MRESDAQFFERLAQQQSPQYLWIGCSDSRVPANVIVDLAPGEMFVHRNVGNVVAPSDPNCLAVLQFAIDVLQVRHIIVCGHYGCGGVRAALDRENQSVIDSWLGHIRRVREKHSDELGQIDNQDARAARLSELNVIEQVANVARADVVRHAWKRAQPLAIHGWIYAINDGLLRDLHVTATSPPN